MKPRRRKVILGITSGVPGQVAAALLKNQDFDVKCVHLAVRPELRGGANAFFRASNEEELQKFCRSIDVTLVHEDVSDEFEALVLDPAVHARLAGKTADTRLLWVSRVLLPRLEKIREDSKADLIATGHPIRMTVDQKTGLPMIGLPAAWREDEAPLVALTDPALLARTLFPVGEITNAMVTKLAVELKVLPEPEDEKPESELPPLEWDGFSAALWRGEWLQNRVSAGLRQPGLLRSTDQMQLGDHDGIVNFRVGERISSAAGYVVGIQAHPGRVVVAGSEGQLAQKKFLLRDARFLSSGGGLGHETYTVLCGPKTQRVEGAVLRYMGDFLSLECETPLVAVSPGQTAVFFKGNQWVGSATFV